MVEKPRRFLSSLHLIEHSRVISTFEKRVYKMSDGHQEIAAKIFQRYNEYSGKPIDRETAASEEFKAYQIFRRSSLKDFTPQPLYVINNPRGQIIGLAVAWEDGRMLTKYVGESRPLSHNDIDLLEDALLNVRGYYPIQDVWSEANLGFHPLNSPRLWFAECEFVTTWDFKIPYAELVKKDMAYLRKQYVVIYK